MEQKQLKAHKKKANPPAGEPPIKHPAVAPAQVVANAQGVEAKSPFSALKRKYSQLKNRCEFDDLLVLAVVFVVSGYLAVLAIMQ